MSGRATQSDLRKAKIEILEGERAGEEIPVLFNPGEYSLDKRIEYGDQSIAGLTTPVTQFVSGDAETLSMELFFDTSEERTDVREHTSSVEELLEIDSDLHAPPVCRFVWGSLVFKSVLESAKTTFNAFLPEGNPVRARMNVTFREYSTPDEQTIEPKRHSADKTTRRRVTEGETLWSIAADEYGDPARWRPIASENDLANPRDARPGMELAVPPLE